MNALTPELIRELTLVKENEDLKTKYCSNIIVFLEIRSQTHTILY
jgi:hypothetical protein